MSQSGDYGATTGIAGQSRSRQVWFGDVHGRNHERFGRRGGRLGHRDGEQRYGLHGLVRAAKSAATVAVSDDDDPLPVISIVGWLGGVTEGV